MYKPLSNTFLLTMLVLDINAQKLPSVQKESVRAPQQVTIDGKFKEWGSSLQAHNNATEISYTITNDDNNLYLIAQAADEMVINKILRGGLTLAIQKTGEKDDKNAVAITYPVSGYAFSVHFNFHIGRTLDTSVERVSAMVENNNKLIEQHIKFIGVKGISGVDSLISIYNEDNIKAAGLLGLNRGYTLELCLPLKYLDLSAGNEPKFAYHIILNGYKRESTIISINNQDGTPATGPRIERLLSSAAQMDAAVSARTDFWGEYTLAKKP